jgi:hypothetical protein
LDDDRAQMDQLWAPAVLRPSASRHAEADELAGFRSVVEDVPADGAAALLIVENEFTDSGRQARPLPLPFPGRAQAASPGGTQALAALMAYAAAPRSWAAT